LSENYEIVRKSFKIDEVPDIKAILKELY